MTFAELKIQVTKIEPGLSAEGKEREQNKTRFL
ncbi:MAG: hypothetical protein ACI9G6_003167, partial [Limisphaerales bacterium]